MTMKIPPRKKREGLVDYAERLSMVYSDAFASKDRKAKGQFFTPKQVSIFMAALFEIDKDEITLLDPGAGVGILSAGFCEIMHRKGKPVSLGIDAFENDPNVIPFLKKVLQECKKELERNGSGVSFNLTSSLRMGHTLVLLDSSIRAIGDFTIL